MKNYLFKILVSLFAVLLTATACSAAKDSTSSPAHNVENYSVARFENGSVTYENHGNGIDEDSVFELGSNGKTVAAYIALKLIDEGKIGLDDRIAPYLDQDLKTDDERMNDITLRNLLCHTAGFSPSYELGVDKKIYSDPGEKFRYSGVGYIYLQNVIENVSGMSMDQAARHYVFEPLGMENSTFEFTRTVTPHINLSSAFLYSFAVFLIAFIVLFAVISIAGKLTKYRFFSLKTGLIVSYIAAGIINITALFFILSKVVVIFAIYFVLSGMLLFLVRKSRKIFYITVPVLTVIILISGFLIPVSVPVTNDLIPKEANCAYTLRSTSRDMSVFCRELMQRYDSGSAMFNDEVTIDDNNSWGLGIAIESGPDGTTYWHSGINPGFQSLYVLYPEQEKFIVVVTGSDYGLDLSKEKANDFLGTDGTWDIAR